MSIATELTALQGDITAARTAITTKGGTVTSGGGSSQLATDIATIPSGGTDALQYVTNGGSLFRGKRNLPTTIVLNMTGYTGEYNYTGYWFYRTYSTSQGSAIDANVTINFGNSAIKHMNEMFYQAYGIGSITITGDLSHVVNYNYCFSNLETLHTLNMEFDFTSVTIGQNFDFASNNVLEEIRFKPKTLGVNCNMCGLNALNATSLISVANGIKDNTTGTITISNTPKALLPIIMGTVADGTFTADASGTVTLQDFITNTKGWTIA